MTDTYQDEIQNLAVRAKEYYKEIERDILSYQQNDRDLILGLDPKGKRYWIGETESSILEQRNKEGNNNLVYFMKIPARQSQSDNKFIATS